MKTLTIQIKNMVCPRCIHFVKQILTDLGIKFSKIDLGYAVLAADQTLDLDAVNQQLEVLDLGLVRDQTEDIVTKINKAAHDYLEDISQLGHKLTLSQYIAQQLGRNYHQLSKIYSQYKGETIEQYFIELRTNKVKELVKHGKLNLSQIAVNVGYSSIHYLSGQFKKYTGSSLSQFKKEWEASLGRPNNMRIALKDRKTEKQDAKCDCLDCGCEEKKPFPQGNESPNEGNVTQPLTIFKREVEPDIYTLPSVVQNLGEYRVHLSV